MSVVHLVLQPHACTCCFLSSVTSVSSCRFLVYVYPFSICSLNFEHCCPTRSSLHRRLLSCAVLCFVPPVAVLSCALFRSFSARSSCQLSFSHSLSCVVPLPLVVRYCTFAVPDLYPRSLRSEPPMSAVFRRIVVRFRILCIFTRVYSNAFAVSWGARLPEHLTIVHLHRTSPTPLSFSRLSNCNPFAWPRNVSDNSRQLSHFLCTNKSALF